MRHLRFANLKQRLSSSVVAMLFIAAQATALAVPFINPATAEAAPICVNDQQGANDQPGQKDLTQFCEDTGAGSISWNWDELSVNGANTLDGCALFDTNGDGFANRSLCVSSTDGVAFTSTIYTCNDSRVDRCAGANAGSPATSSCSLAVTATQPFAAGASSPNDLTATCLPTIADTASGDLIDVCSYPSGQPNSDPSDCIVYKKSTARIEVRKVLSPAGSGLFDLKINGTTYADNIGDGGTTGEVVVDAGSVTVLEAENAPTDLGGYNTTLVCRTLNGTNQTALISTTPAGADTRQGSFTANDGDDIVCVFTNTQQTGSIKVVKDVINDNGSTKTYADFHFTLGGNQYSFDPTTSPDGEKVVTLPVGSGPFTITEPEANTMGYATTYSNCANLAVVAGQTQTCTITNNDIAPQLIVKKHVINDNGGTKTAADFMMNVSGTNVSSSSFAGDETGVNVTLNAGNYSVSETNLAGYAPSLSSDCVGTIALGETKTCTITNDDQAPSLTLNKIVSNLYGGTATESAWTLTATGPSLLSGLGAAGSADVVSGSDFKAGVYTLSETGSPSGYSASSWTCTNGVVVTNNQITLANGQPTVCSITNSDVAPIIRILKEIINPYGNTTPLADSFLLTLDGNSVLSGADTQVVAGSHTVGETTTGTGYSFTSFSGQNCTITDGVMTAIGIIGGTTICTITNTAIQPKLIVIKQVINDNGGSKSSDDFTMTVSDNTQNVPNFPGSETGTEIGVNEGPYSVNELADDGYTKTLSADCAGTIVAGQVKTCTITNDDKPGTLTVNKVVDGGDDEAADFSFKIDGSDTDYSFVNGQSTDEGSKTIELNAGTYSVTENDAFGYDKDDSDCKNVVVSNGAEATCTITNTAQRKVMICHATSAHNNPYVSISVPISAIDGIAGNQAGQGDHYGEHKGPVWFDGIDENWGDIIPPLEGIHNGLNWDDYGQATYENDCTPPAQVIVTKYNDLNRNGSQDENEPTLPNWDFNLTNGQCEVEDFLLEAIEANTDCYNKTQTTEEDGTTTFVNVPTGSYQLSETIPEDSNWNLSNIDCDVREGGLDGDTYYFSIGSGQTIHCSVGNYQDTGTITVVKKLTPSTDAGKFNLNINGTTYAANIGDGGTTGAVELVTGTYSVSETAGTNTNLDDYESSYVCMSGDTVVLEGNGTTIAQIDVAKDEDVVCSFYNNKGEVLSEQIPPAATLVNTGTDTLISSLVSLLLIGSATGLAIASRRSNSKLVTN